MEQMEILKEIRQLRKEVNELKGGQTQGTVIAVMSLFLGIGMAILLYSINLLNEALKVTSEVWSAFLFAGIGLLIMMFSGFIATSLDSKRKRKR